MRTPACLAALLLIFLSLRPLSDADAQTPVPAGKAESVVGVASVIRATSRADLRRGTTVNVGDRIVTGPDTRVRIRLIDGATLVVGARSEIVLRAAGMWGRRRTIALNLIFGIARAIAPPGHRSVLEIWTGAAIASVRHTDWIVVVRSDRTAVFAVDGRVSVIDRKKGREHILRESNGIDLLSDGRVVGPRRWGEARIARVLAATSAP